jgi:hypothetical protein
VPFFGCPLQQPSADKISEGADESLDERAVVAVYDVFHLFLFQICIHELALQTSFLVGHQYVGFAVHLLEHPFDGFQQRVWLLVFDGDDRCELCEDVYAGNPIVNSKSFPFIKNKSN